MIGNDEEVCGICERGIVGEDLRIDVTVHADERESLRLAVDLLGDTLLLRSEGQSPVRVKSKRRHE
jgi:hypothetical protein